MRHQLSGYADTLPPNAAYVNITSVNMLLLQSDTRSPSTSGAHTLLTMLHLHRGHNLFITCLYLFRYCYSNVVDSIQLFAIWKPWQWRQHHSSGRVCISLSTRPVSQRHRCCHGHQAIYAETKEDVPRP